MSVSSSSCSHTGRTLLSIASLQPQPQSTPQEPQEWKRQDVVKGLLEKTLVVDQMEDGLQKKTSTVWETFGKIVTVSDRKVVKGFVPCLNCGKAGKGVLAWRPGSGYGSFRAHKCGVRPNVHGNWKTGVESADRQLLNPSGEAKRKVLQSVVEFCGIDMRPFSSITGQGFVNLAQCLIDIGQGEGRVDVKKLLPDRHLVSRESVEAAKIVKQKCVPEIKAAVLLSVYNKQPLWLTYGQVK